MRRLFVLGVLLASTLGLAGTAQAYDVSAGDQTSLASDRTINGTYYVGGNVIDIAGKVKGDVFCAGQNVTINGPVEGDVICAAQTITINGNVSGNVRLAAQTVTLNGKVGRNASIFTQSLVTGKDSVISGELMAQSQSISLGGIIMGETYGSAERLTINGQVDGKVRFDSGAVIIGSAAQLKSGLEYTSSQKADIKSGAQITGSTQQNIPKASDNRRQDPANALLAGLLFDILTGLVIGALLLWLAPRFVAGAVSQTSRPGVTMLLGFAGLVLTPIAAFMIMFTVIGIPAGILGLVVWAVALYLSRIVTALALGTIFYRRLSKGTFRAYAAGALGIVVAGLVFAIPFIGGFASFLAVLFGLGVMVQALRNHIDREDDANHASTPAKV